MFRNVVKKRRRKKKKKKKENCVNLLCTISDVNAVATILFTHPVFCLYFPVLTWNKLSLSSLVDDIHSGESINWPGYIWCRNRPATLTRILWKKEKNVNLMVISTHIENNDIIEKRFIVKRRFIWCSNCKGIQKYVRRSLLKFDITLVVIGWVIGKFQSCNHFE